MAIDRTEIDIRGGRSLVIFAVGCYVFLLAFACVGGFG